MSLILKPSLVLLNMQEQEWLDKTPLCKDGISRFIPLQNRTVPLGVNFFHASGSGFVGGVVFFYPCNTGFWPFICNVTWRTILLLHFYSSFPHLLPSHWRYTMQPKLAKFKMVWFFERKQGAASVRVASRKDIHSKSNPITRFKSCWYCTRPQLLPHSLNLADSLERIP